MRYSIYLETFDERNEEFTKKTVDMNYADDVQHANYIFNLYKDRAPSLSVPETYSARVVINIIDDVGTIINYHFKTIIYDFSERAFKPGK